MQFKEVVNKIIAGNPLDDAEKAFLQSLEVDALKDNLASVTGERDELDGQLKKLRRENKIRGIAEKHGCIVPDYLDFLAEKMAVDIDDASQVDGFVENAKNSAPGCFRASVRPGSGETSVPPETSAFAAPEGIDAIIDSIARL